MSRAAHIQVTVNGLVHRTQEGIRLLDLLDQIGEPHAAALVERNRRLVRKEDLATTLLEDGDSIEVILPAFGG